MCCYRFLCIPLNVHNSETCTCDMIQCYLLFNYLAIGSFSQHSQQFKTVRSNSLAVSVHTFTCQLHLFCLIATKGQREAYLFILIYVCITAILHLLLWLCYCEVTNIILNMRGGKAKRFPCLYGIKWIDLNISLRGKRWNTDLCIADVLCLQVNVKNPRHPNAKTEHIQTLTWNITHFKFV